MDSNDYKQIGRIVCGASALLVAMAACTSASPTDATATAADLRAGTIRYRNIEGGCWNIEFPDMRVEPIGLPVEFMEDGLAVNVRLESIPDAVTACQSGIPMRVIKIAKR